MTAAKVAPAGVRVAAPRPLPSTAATLVVGARAAKATATAVATPTTAVSVLAAQLNTWPCDDIVFIYPGMVGRAECDEPRYCSTGTDCSDCNNCGSSSGGSSRRRSSSGSSCSQSCDEYGGYAPVCPGTVPRGIGGCCYRNCNHDVITDIGSRRSGVHTHYIRNAVQFACRLRSDVCAVCDQVDEFKPVSAADLQIPNSNSPTHASVPSVDLVCKCCLVLAWCSTSKSLPI